MSSHHFEVRLVRSAIGRADDQRRTLAGLGLRRRGQSVALRDTPAVRGMIYKVVHLVEARRRDGAPPPSRRASRAAASGPATPAGHP